MRLGIWSSATHVGGSESGELRRKERVRVEVTDLQMFWTSLSSRGLTVIYRTMARFTMEWNGLREASLTQGSGVATMRHSIQSACHLDARFAFASNDFK